jgi:hypothetical protein
VNQFRRTVTVGPNGVSYTGLKEKKEEEKTSYDKYDDYHDTSSAHNPFATYTSYYDAATTVAGVGNNGSSAIDPESLDNSNSSATSSSNLYDDISPNYISDVAIKCQIVGDNYIGLNEAGLLFLSKARPHSELIYASFTNNTMAKPYAIFRGEAICTIASIKLICLYLLPSCGTDHFRKEIIIVVRGTLSLEDCITDAVCDAEEVLLYGECINCLSQFRICFQLSEAGEIWGFNGAGKYAHSGMLRAAMHIRKEIETSGILDQFGLAKVCTTVPILVVTRL